MPTHSHIIHKPITFPFFYCHTECDMILKQPNPSFIPPYLILLSLSLSLMFASIFSYALALEHSWLSFFLSVINIVVGLCLETRGKLPKQMATLLGGAEPGTKAAGLCCGSTEIQGFH